MAESDDSVEDLIAGIDFMAIAESVKKSKNKSEGILDVVWSDEESFDENVNIYHNMKTPISVNKSDNGLTDQSTGCKEKCLSYLSDLNSANVTLRKRNRKTSSSASSVSNSCCIGRTLSFDNCEPGGETCLNTKEIYFSDNDDDSGLFIDCEQVTDLDVDVLEDIINQYDTVEDIGLDVSTTGKPNIEFTSGDYEIFISQNDSQLKASDDSLNHVDIGDSPLFTLDENPTKELGASIGQLYSVRHEDHQDNNLDQSTSSRGSQNKTTPEKSISTVSVKETACGVSEPEAITQDGIMAITSRESLDVSISDDCMKENRGFDIHKRKYQQKSPVHVNMCEKSRNVETGKLNEFCKTSNNFQNNVNKSIEYVNKPWDINDDSYHDQVSDKKKENTSSSTISDDYQQQDKDFYELSYEEPSRTPELSSWHSPATVNDFQTDQVDVLETPMCREKFGKRCEQDLTSYPSSLETHNSITENIFSPSDDENFEAFLTEMKTPRQEKNTEHLPSMESFIVDDWVDSSSGEDEPPPLLNRILADLKTTSEERSISIFTSSRKESRITIVSSSDEENTPYLINKNIVKPKKGILSTTKTNVSKPLLKPPTRNVRLDDRTSSSTRGIKKILTPHINTPKRLWQENRDDLSKQLFCCYNETVFQNKLPHDMPITWNKHMRKTAGFCYYMGSSINRRCRIELSEKVVDCCDRIRDTLIHELCHAATWLIDGIRAGHGPHWKKWADRARCVHRDLPPISRCHSYEINYKFNYRCTKCDYSFGRHSKSVNLKTARCPYCVSSLKLLPKLNKDGTPAKSRAPTKFSLFVKENYGEVKNELSGSHQEIMKELSKRFSETLITKESF